MICIVISITALSFMKGKDSDKSKPVKGVPGDFSR